MANVIKKATNRWTKGLVMDFSPENTRNEVLTHALNATLLTFNGNEMSLQNDMGNARVETAYLPDGYIPVGTCEYGGIIYIVSYNPLEDKSLIGCFPSPERNISSDELGLSNKTLSADIFTDIQTGEIKQTTQYVLLKDNKLNPGDKFIVYANKGIYEEKLANLETWDNTQSTFIPESLPMLALNIVSIEDSGKITYLNSSVTQYEKDYNGSKYKYHILGSDSPSTPLQNTDLDSYRNVLSSGYNVFRSKTSGKLAILAELIMIDSYSVTHSVEPVIDVNGNAITDMYNIIIHTEVDTQETIQKYNVTPQLAGYHLKNSLGLMTLKTSIPIGEDSLNPDTKVISRPLFDSNSNINPDFFTTHLDDIFDLSSLPTLIQQDQLIEMYMRFYNTQPYPNSFINFSSKGTYHTDLLYNTNGEMTDIILGTIVLPKQICNNNIGLELHLPFKYEYTLVPCMNYGKLDHLAVSNTINFENLHDFRQSSFNVWKYRVDGPTIHLQFGADIKDTFLTPAERVSGLVLEFYDLWGFVGSIIIDNKKAYSGVFNKVLTLNSLGALDSRKIDGVIDTSGPTITGAYLNNYVHNINIALTDDGKYSLNGEEVNWDLKNGWRYEDTTLTVENDCTCLYPNILYGVKAYFVQDTINTPKTNEHIFTLADLFFMYTMPIFNNYYYTESNFNTLGKPELDFMVTYRLEDDSTKSALTYNTEIVDGYKSGSLISEYVKGKLENTTELHDIKYYEYEGKSKLWLEIGLKKDYDDINLRYDRNINNYFSCELLLVNNDGTGSLSVQSSENLTKDIALNYTGTSFENTDPNTLNFTTDSSILTVSVGELQNYSFLDPSGISSSYIEILYKLIVGYKIDITNIRDTKVPATTVCALCHKRDDGTYNYEDFGIEEILDEDGNPMYLSTTIFYNGGTNTEVQFGLCRQIQSNGNALEQCLEIIDANHDAIKIQTPGRLNSGQPLLNLVLYIGKLAFCEPHLSGFSSKNGVSVSPKNDTLWINPDLSLYTEDERDHNYTYGFAPSNNLYTDPRYLMCLNTKNMIDRYSEFPVNIEYEAAQTPENTIFIGRGTENRVDPVEFEPVVYARKFIGLTGEQLTSFNKSLLETMKGVYAYNPDYDSLQVRAGDVSIVDNKVSFVSNLLIQNSNITFNDSKTLNDLIGFGNIRVSDYLTLLNKYSESTDVSNNKTVINVKSGTDWVDLVNFTPNIEYCGGRNNRVVISTLTYNTPVPTELYDELTFNSDSIVVKLENGEVAAMLTGDLNKKALYGFKLDTNLLIQLDVSNYEINSNGAIIFKSQLVEDYPLQLRIEDVKDFCENGLSGTITWSDGSTTLYKIVLVTSNTITCDEDGHVLLTGTENWIFDEYVGQNPIQGHSESLKLNVACIIEGANVTEIKLHGGAACDSAELIGLPDDCPVEDLSSPSASGFDEMYCTGSVTEENWINYNLSGNINQCLCKMVFNLTLNTIEAVITRNYALNTLYFNSINNISYPTTKYLNTKNFYKVSDTYKNSRLKGTELTINDLVYEPNPDGHRLYMRPSCFTYNNTPRAKLYYRTLTADYNDDHGYTNQSWKGDTDYYNTLFLNTGPCFTPDNLS